MKISVYINILLEIEKRIEDSYLKLQYIEAHKEVEEDYDYYFKEIKTWCEKEVAMLSTMMENFSLKEIKDALLKKKTSLKEIPISLGYLPDASIYRLLYLVEKMQGDDILDYASILKTDINRILLIFLEHLINNNYYEEIREDLILYKYSIIFMDLDLENDFLLNKLDNNIELQANNYRTFDFPGYIYVDKTILDYESEDYLSFIINHEDFKQYSSTYALVVISVINVLARFTLCEEETLNLVYDDLKCLLESDTSRELKDLVNDMYQILKTIKSQILWTRN